MKKRLLIIPMILLFAALTGATALAAGYSSAWYQSGSNWCVMGPNKRQLMNCWFCDDAYPGNGKNVWYLLDTNGFMVSSPLVKDGTGNYYSLETRHEGVYGSLRYQNGFYDGIYITFSQSHNGTFGAITNVDAIEKLKAKYGVYDVSHINNSNCYYSSSWIGTTPTPSTTEYTIAYYFDGAHYATRTRSSRTFTVIDCSRSNFKYWEDSRDGCRYYPGDEYYFESGRTYARLNAVFESDDNVRSLTYFVNDQVYYTDRTHSNTIQVIGAPTTTMVGCEFLYWEDDYGNHWNPGEWFTFTDRIERMKAVFRALTN